VSQARERLAVRPRLADGLALMRLDGSAHEDVVRLDPSGVRVLRLGDAAAISP
jgi:hypothetical protein